MTRFLIVTLLLKLNVQLNRFEGDTGSTEVQIATISLRLSNLAEHMLKNHKDNHTKRGMTALFHRRRKLMQYLRRERFELYEQALIDFKIDETEVLEWGVRTPQCDARFGLLLSFFVLKLFVANAGAYVPNVSVSQDE